MFHCIEYHYGYYSSHTSVNIVEYNNLGKEAHLPFCGWAHKTRHPSSVQSLQQSFTKHLLCAKNSYHSHPGCGGAARKGGAPLVNAQPSAHSRPGLLSNPSMGRGEARPGNIPPKLKSPRIKTKMDDNSLEQKWPIFLK